jgi:hypothetical protein
MGRTESPFRGTSERSRLASVKSCWEMHGASSDVENSKILELSGVHSKAMSLFVRIDTVCQSDVGRHPTAVGHCSDGLTGNLFCKSIFLNPG